MLWMLYQDINFYQVFLNSSKVYNENNNQIYSLEYDQNTQLNKFEQMSSIYINKKICEMEPITINFAIKILDQLISYTNLSNNETNVFTQKMNFIPPNKNSCNVPIFNYSYKKVNSTRMPNLIETQYNFASELNFKIYNINKNVQYIIETNNDIVKKYWVCTDVELLNNMILQN